MAKWMLASLALAGLLQSGCSSLGYYAQAIDGHFRLMARARPIPELVADAATDPALREQLARAGAIREFASRELALPNNGSYRSYARLDRPFVVWNVFAAAEFSVDLRQWCMLFVGCVNYRGYYQKGDAERYADDLRAAGADTQVGGVSAYSTLGYFDDPVLDTFLRFGDREVARIVFHELAHQLIYVRGDSAFDESFATAVENEGVRRWLTWTAPERLADFEAQVQRKRDFLHLVAATRDTLRVRYAAPGSSRAQRDAKAEVFAHMRRAYAELKARWGGYAGYDAWFAQPLNNATLGSVALYARWVPAFEALLACEAGDLPRFYRAVAQLADLPKKEREQELERLLPRSMSASPPSENCVNSQGAR